MFKDSLLSLIIFQDFQVDYLGDDDIYLKGDDV